MKLKSTSELKMSPFSMHSHKDRGYYAIIEPSTASWAVVSRDALPLLKYLETRKNLAEIKKSFPESADVENVLDTLWSAGLLSVDEERNVRKDLFRCSYGPPYFFIMNMTNDCNLRCRYCYADAGSSRAKMTLDTAMNVIEQGLSLPNRRLHILFHGGEPLLNLDCIIEICNRVQALQTDKRITFAIQTNGTLLNDDTVTFLKEAQIRVGLSFDGCSEAHNRLRVDKLGKSVWKRIIKVISLLKKHDVQFGAISLLTKANAFEVDKIIDFFADTGIREFSFNHFVPAGRAATYLHEISLTTDELFAVGKTILNKLVEHNSKVDKDERIFERGMRFLARNIITRKRSYMCMRSPCGAGTSLLSFSPNGGIYPCDDFSGERRFLLGNIYEDELATLVKNSPIIALFEKCTVDSTSRCRDCIWRWICCGDCAARRYYTFGTITHQGPLCEYYRRIIPYVLELLVDNKLDPELICGPLEQCEETK